MKSVLSLVILVSLAALIKAEDLSEGVRATTDQHVIELVIVVDYSAFKHWYDMTSVNQTYNERVTKTKQILINHLQTLFLSTNSVYKTLEEYNIYIQFKIVDVIIAEHPADSSWTETNKVLKGSEYVNDPNDVINHFGRYSRTLMTTTPFDHAMTITRYGLQEADGTNLSGYAVASAECTSRSISVVRLEDGIRPAFVIAHELGHSLGCQHDGTGNACSSKEAYIMASGSTEPSITTPAAPTTTLSPALEHVPHNRRFSPCSVEAIQNYIAKLNRDNNNCFLVTNNHHPNPNVVNVVPKMYGQLYSADTQCRQAYGNGSYVCRGLQHSNYTNFCTHMGCSNGNSCYFRWPADGTQCGDGKWCMQSVCVKDNKAPAAMDTCPIGDQEGIVMNGMTCKQLLAADQYACFKQQIKNQCCYSCSKNGSGQSGATVSLDEQCKIKQGNSSFFCRGLPNYNVQDVSNVICKSLFCKVPTKTYCFSSHAEDKTTCGNKMWCMNGVCVHDDNAPSVSSDCIFGDVPSTLDSHGLTCSQIVLPENHWHCYGGYINKYCCQTCPSIKRNVTGCEYGDKSGWCHSHIRSESDKLTCYNMADTCCETCAKYANRANLGCEYGDKLHGCHADMCSRYNADTRAKCCETCKAGPAVG